MEKETSNSGFIEPATTDMASNLFSGLVEIPSSGFNSLYKAKRNGRLYMLKGLKAEFRDKPAYRDLLKKEFDISVQLNHPNIVSVHSFEEDLIVGPCIVMDYIEGLTLREFLKSNPDKGTRLRIVKELLSAMGYYHSLQVIHRDLKPDNILITHNGSHVKLIDFGLGDTDFHTVLKQPAGSDKYAAPEQRDPSVTLDCRADIYAFGKILPQIFPNKYGRIVEKCTKENRDERYSCADDIISDLDSRKWIMPVVVTLIIIAIAAVVFLLLRGGNDSQQSTADEETEIVDEQVPSEEEKQSTEIPSKLQFESGDAKLTELCEKADSIFASERKRLDKVLSEGENGKYSTLAFIHTTGIGAIALAKTQKQDTEHISLAQKSQYNTFCLDSYHEHFNLVNETNALPDYSQHILDSLDRLCVDCSNDEKYDFIEPRFKKISDSIRDILNQYHHIADSIRQAE